MRCSSISIILAAIALANVSMAAPVKGKSLGAPSEAVEQTTSKVYQTSQHIAKTVKRHAIARKVVRRSAANGEPEEGDKEEEEVQVVPLPTQGKPPSQVAAGAPGGAGAGVGGTVPDAAATGKKPGKGGPLDTGTSLTAPVTGLATATGGLERVTAIAASPDSLTAAATAPGGVTSIASGPGVTSLTSGLTGSDGPTAGLAGGPEGVGGLLGSVTTLTGNGKLDSFTSLAESGLAIVGPDGVTDTANKVTGSGLPSNLPLGGKLR